MSTTLSPVASASKDFIGEAKKSLLRRRHLIKSTSRLITILAIVCFIFSIVQTLIIPTTSILYTIISGVCIIPFSVGYFLLKDFDKSPTEIDYANLKLRIQISSYVLVLSFLAAISVVQVNESYPNGGALTAAFLVIPVLTAVLGLSTREIIVAGVLIGIILIADLVLKNLAASDDVSKALSSAIPNLVTWLTLLALATAGIAIFSRRLAGAIQVAEEQASDLMMLANRLNQATGTASGLSNELTGVTIELNATSRQQVANSQEQLAAITQVATSLVELSETASQIAGSAKASSQAAEQTLNIAANVQEGTDLIEEVATKGSRAVEDAVSSVSRLRNRIELLGQRLLSLTGQTRQVGTIIGLIEEISDETHLLALNASIEAAGTVGGAENATSSENRGERFGVIAQEIKNLADRSRDSTEEIRQTINEMQGAVAAAVLVAEEGKKETTTALALSAIAGEAIMQLNEVIRSNSVQAQAIVDSVKEVKIRCEEISLATGQQRSANQQIVQTMEAVSAVSAQSVGGLSGLSETVEQVKDKVVKLNLALSR